MLGQLTRLAGYIIDDIEHVIEINLNNYNYVQCSQKNMAANAQLHQPLGACDDY